MKRMATVLGLLSMLSLSACFGGGNGGGGNPATQSNFTTQVSQIAATAPDNTEPVAIDNIQADAPDNTEPVPVQ